MNALVDVEIQLHLLVLDELHDEVGVSSLTLSNRRIDVYLSMFPSMIEQGTEEER